jgi:chemotaxis signal transduction protein
MTPMVRFQAGGQGYAVRAEDVRRVRPAAGLTPLPSVRPGVAGVVRHQDEALPVLSLLGGSGARLLMLEAGGRSFGLLVEEVAGVTMVDEQRLGPAPEGQDQQLVTGVAAVGGDLLMVVDASVLGQTALS